MKYSAPSQKINSFTLDRHSKEILKVFVAYHGFRYPYIKDE